MVDYYYEKCECGHSKKKHRTNNKCLYHSCKCKGYSMMIPKCYKINHNIIDGVHNTNDYPNARITSTKMLGLPKEKRHYERI